MNAGLLVPVCPGSLVLGGRPKTFGENEALLL